MQNANVSGSFKYMKFSGGCCDVRYTRVFIERDVDLSGSTSNTSVSKKGAYGAPGSSHYSYGSVLSGSVLLSQVDIF